LISTTHVESLKISLMSGKYDHNPEAQREMRQMIRDFEDEKIE
jgi:hypothetical protein